MRNIYEVANRILENEDSFSDEERNRALSELKELNESVNDVSDDFRIARKLVNSKWNEALKDIPS